MLLQGNHFVLFGEVACLREFALLEQGFQLQSSPHILRRDFGTAVLYQTNGFEYAKAKIAIVQIPSAVAMFGRAGDAVMKLVIALAT